jgi:hypothetical protein
LYHSINHIVTSRDSKYQHTKLSKPFTHPCASVWFLWFVRERERKANKGLLTVSTGREKVRWGDLQTRRNTSPPRPQQTHTPKERKRVSDEREEGGVRDPQNGTRKKNQRHAFLMGSKEKWIASQRCTATVNQHPPVQHEGWMINGLETVFCCVSVH